MDKFHKIWIYCLICFLAGCAMGGGHKAEIVKTLEALHDLCPNGVAKVDFGTNDKGEQIVKSATCQARVGL